MEIGFIQRKLLEHKPSPEGQCYTEELLDIVQLLLTRELQLGELAEAAEQLLEDYEVAETQLEGKTRESKVCIRAQQTAKHELRLCTVRFP